MSAKICQGQNGIITNQGAGDNQSDNDTSPDACETGSSAKSAERDPSNTSGDAGEQRVTEGSESGSESDNNRQSDDGGQGKSRKRVRRPEKWKKSKRKRRRNAGKRYTATSNKVVSDLRSAS